MDVKLYLEHDGKREQLEETIELLDAIVEEYGVKRITHEGQNVLAREAADGRVYEYHLQEAHGGNTLQRLMDSGVRFTLWVARGETTSKGRRRAFHVHKQYILRNLLPVRCMTANKNSSYDVLTVVTLDRPERTDVTPPTAAQMGAPLE
jgi:hypothetical protein